MSFIIGSLKNSDLNSIKLKLIILYLLNVSDIIFTIFLVNTGVFMEVNLIMAPLVYNNQVLSLLIKIVAPVFLLLCLFYRMRKGATGKQLFQANIIIIFSVIFYGIINVFHIVWCLMYFLLY
jgi:hypothetical protein